MSSRNIKLFFTILIFLISFGANAERYSPDLSDYITDNSWLVVKPADIPQREWSTTWQFYEGVKVRGSLFSAYVLELILLCGMFLAAVGIYDIFTNKFRIPWPAKAIWVPLGSGMFFFGVFFPYSSFSWVLWMITK